jgi:hypothetical protein
VLGGVWTPFQTLVREDFSGIGSTSVALDGTTAALSSISPVGLMADPLPVARVPSGDGVGFPGAVVRPSVDPLSDCFRCYLDEFVFRHDRRRQPTAAFQTLLGLGSTSGPQRIRRHPRHR